MAKNEKMVEQITSMDVDFAQWYTDVVKTAELADYSGVKGCMVIRPYGYATWTPVLRRWGTRTFICPCSFPKVFCKKKKTTWKDLPPNAHG